MGRVLKKHARDFRRRSKFASRGNRTEEEHKAFMAKSEADYFADKKYIETHRGVEIWRHPNRTYLTKYEGMSASDVETLRYMIDSKLDTGSAVDELLEGQMAVFTKSRRRERIRSLESLQSQHTALHRMQRHKGAHQSKIQRQRQVLGSQDVQSMNSQNARTRFKIRRRQVRAT